MDELRRAMLDAGTPHDEWQAELPFLIEAGQKRVRRRRMIATGIAAAVVTVIGTTAALAGIPGLNKADPDPVKDRHSGVYVEERLAPAEVERRCNVVLNANRPRPVEWVAGVDAGRRAVPAEESVEPVETRVGWSVELTPRGEMADPNTSMDDGSGTLPGGGGGPDSQTGFCTIPQEALLDDQSTAAPLPMADQTDAILERCSTTARYDFGGWRVGTAHASEGSLNAVLMSANGYGVVCTLDNAGGGDVTFHAMPYSDDEGRPILPVDDSGPADPDRYGQVFPRCSTLGGSGMETCDAVGVIVGLPHRHRIEVRIGGRFVTVATTEHGAFAYEFRARSANAGDEQVRVVAPDGGVVWTETRDNGGPEGGGDGVRQEDGSGVYKLP